MFCDSHKKDGCQHESDEAQGNTTPKLDLKSCSVNRVGKVEIALHLISPSECNILSYMLLVW